MNLKNKKKSYVQVHTVVYYNAQIFHTAHHMYIMQIKTKSFSLYINNFLSFHSFFFQDDQKILKT